MTLSQELFAFRRPLLEPGDRGPLLTSVIAGGKLAFETLPLPSLLDQLLAGRPGARAALDAALRLDHFGMLLAPGDRVQLAAAAAAAGFPLAHAAFPSALFTRELGRLADKPHVPTIIFKAHGRTALGGSLAIEIFVPEIDVAQAEVWISRGVGNHVAISLADRAAFAAAERALRDEGLRVSWFMADRPLFIPAEGVTLVYFDLEEGDTPLRLELRVAGDVTEGT